MVRLGMGCVLADRGQRVLEEDGSAAAVLARVEQARREVVVLGLEEPRSYELAERVRAVAPTTRVVLLGRGANEVRILSSGGPPRRVDRNALDALLGELAAT